MRPKIDNNAHLEMARRLYWKMPGALRPLDERGYLWGEVESTVEWQFCERLAKEILTAIQIAAQTAGIKG